MFFRKSFFLSVFLLALTSLSYAQAPIAVRWEMGTNGAEKGFYSSRFVITNNSGKDLGRNWQFFFNQFSRTVKLPDSTKVNIEEVSTTYYRITPNDLYKDLKNGDSLVVDMLMRGTMVNISYTPMGGHLVLDGNLASPIPVKIEIEELCKKGQWIERSDYPDGNRMYAINEKLQIPTQDNGLGEYDIFPTPKSVDIKGGGHTSLRGLVSIKSGLFKRGTKRAANYLKCELAARGAYVIAGQKTQISLKINKKLGPAEAYNLKVENGNVSIIGASEDGLLNGVKTLIAAVDHSKNGELRNVEITDQPDFAYRGFMLDIARNYTGLNNLRRFIDLLAYYKINKFQFHFTDDEAWRVEIPGLPELTEVASRRGCTLTEKGFLAQIFDGNGNPDDLSQSANGFLSRSEFVELLKYAHARGVKIIPEVETPGHARAAIVAMKNRYDRLINQDRQAAEQYKLWDTQDRPNFTSAQSYHDNVLNVAQDGVYNFIEKVVTELQLMYKDAGLKLDVIHMGGDEVANGAWDNSPDVQNLMAKNGFKSNHEVNEYFIKRVTDFVYPRGILIEGWQEVAQNHSNDFNNLISKRFAGVNAWSTVGSRAKVPYEIANSGYPVIMSNVTNFYMDMGYSWHQYEKGLHWGGMVDEFAAWDAQPWNIYCTARTDYNGDPIDLTTAALGKPALERRENIVGVQGQMWAETIRDFNQIQCYALPKIMGLVERGWNSTPDWAGKDESAYDTAKAAYNRKIGNQELPVLYRLGYKFHLGQPGIIVKDGLLHANAQYEGEVVHYTTDGSEPTAMSPVWTKPVSVPAHAVIKAKAFYLGQESVTTYLWQEK